MVRSACSRRKRSRSHLKRPLGGNVIRPLVALAVLVVAGVTHAASVDLANTDVDVQAKLGSGDIFGALTVLDSVHRPAKADAVTRYLADRYQLTCLQAKIRKNLALEQRACEEGYRNAKLLPASEAVLLAENAGSLASVYGDLGRYDEADTLFRTAEDAYGRAGQAEGVECAIAVGNHGEMLRLRGKFADALVLLRKAFATLDKPLLNSLDDFTSVLTNLGMAEVQSGDWDAGERDLKRAVELLNARNSPNVTYPLVALGILANKRGNFDVAEKLYTDLLRDHPHDVSMNLNVRMNLAVMYVNAGRLPEGAVLLQGVLDGMASEYGRDNPAFADQLVNVGLVAEQMGNYAEGQRSLNEAIAIYTRANMANSPVMASAYNNLALSYVYIGDCKEGAAYLELALGIKSLDACARMTSLTNAGQALIQCQDYDQAEKKLHEAIGEAGACKNAEGGLQMASATLGDLFLAKGDAVQANLVLRPLADRASTPSSQKFRPDILSSLAIARAAAGDRAGAKKLLVEAIVTAEQVWGPEHPSLTSLLGLLATLKWQGGENADLLADWTRMVDISTKNIQRIVAVGSDQQRQGATRKWSATTSSLITLAMQTRRPELAALAATYILRVKGRALEETAHLYGRDRDDPAVAALGKLRAELSTVAWKPPPDLSAAEYRALVADMEKREEALEERLALQPDDRAATGTAVTLERVQAAIQPGTALIEYVVYAPLSRTEILSDRLWEPGRYAAFVLRSSGPPVWADLGTTREIETAILSAQRAFSKADGDWHAAAKQLANLVLAPLLPALHGTSDFVIGPDGSLGLIPIAALADEDGRMIVENRTVSYVTSGREILRTSKAHSWSRSLVMADPDFDRSPVGPTPVNATKPSAVKMKFAPLPETASEGQAVSAQLGDAEFLVHDAASEAALKQRASPRVLHLATHGFFVSEAAGGTGRSSGLALAGANAASGGGDDGFLTAAEVAALDLRSTQLAVLSACDTGVGEPSAGEGLSGLRRALSIAGAQSQVLSLWRVSSGSTARLMGRYYSFLRRGEGRATALRDAQLEFVRSKDLSPPYFWAAFVESGDRTSLTDEAPLPPVAVTGSGCTCVVGTRRGAPASPVAVSLTLAAAALARRRQNRRLRRRTRCN